jgi:hypothetical protein
MVEESGRGGEVGLGGVGWEGSKERVDNDFYRGRSRKKELRDLDGRASPLPAFAHAQSSVNRTGFRVAV